MNIPNMTIGKRFVKINKQRIKINIYAHPKNWCISWTKDIYYHREDGPAEIWGDGRKFYYVYGYEQDAREN